MLAGPCPLVEVPDYLGRCQVLLDLLRDSQPYNDVVPPRLYEYLSTGKPIVSMLWPEQVELFPDVVYGAHSPEEFLHLCQQALAEDPGWVDQRRRDYGAAAAWSRRARCEPAPARLAASPSFFFPPLVGADKKAPPPCQYRGFLIKLKSLPCWGRRASYGCGAVFPLSAAQHPAGGFVRPKITGKRSQAVRSRRAA